jgi:hypothetical protein
MRPFIGFPLEPTFNSLPELHLPRNKGQVWRANAKKQSQLDGLPPLRRSSALPLCLLLLTWPLIFILEFIMASIFGIHAFG